MRLITLIAVGKHSSNLEDKLGEKHIEQEQIVSKRMAFDKFAYIDSM